MNIIFAMLFISMRQNAGPQADDTSVVIEQVRWYTESWRSLEFDVNTTYNFIKPYKKMEGLYNELNEHCIVTQEGFFKKTKVGKTRGGPISKYEFYVHENEKYDIVIFDGKDGGSRTRIETGSLAQKPADFEGFDWPFPFSLYYIQKIPLCESLKKASFLGSEQVDGVNCRKFEFSELESGFKNQKTIYFFANDDGRLTKVDAFKGPMIAWTWKSDAYSKEKGILYPNLSHRDVFETKGSPSLLPARLTNSIKFSTAHRIEHLEVDRSYSSSVFHAKPQPGASVYNADTKKAWIQPGKKSSASDVTANAKELGKEDVLRATDREWGLNLPVACGAFLAGGILLLIICKKKLNR